MFKKHFNLEKELQKVQKKGRYNPKFKTLSIVAFALCTITLGVSFSVYSYQSGDTQAYNSKVNKMLDISLQIENGTLNTLASRVLNDNEILNVQSTDGLYQSEDNDGTTYYFKGNVQNNYVSFAGVRWRIVRINGDGTIRLVLDETLDNISYNTLSEELKYVGYTYDNNPTCGYSAQCDSQSGTSSQIKQYLEDWYTKYLSDYTQYITTGSYCNNSIDTLDGIDNFICQDTTLDYGGYYQLDIGLLSVNEVNLSLLNSASFLLSDTAYWTMSNSANQIYTVSDIISLQSPDSQASLRPVINLKAENMYTSGDGTQNNPYEVIELTDSTTSFVSTVNYQENISTILLPNVDMEFDEVTCTNNQSATYDEENNILTIIPTSSSTCTITFKREEKNLYDTILANNELNYDEQNYSYASPSSIVQSNSSGLFQTTDNDGTTYYFRGNVDNNYLTFAGYTWRIVRINGDGTIRLVLDDVISIASEVEVLTYSNNSLLEFSSSNLNSYLQAWYDNNLSVYDNSIINANYCNDYDSNLDTINDLKCSNVYNGKIGLLTVGELVMAGMSSNEEVDEQNYLYTVNSWWTASVSGDKIYLGSSFITVADVTQQQAIRPVINLDSTLVITSGDGSQSNPYILK